jgi:hypothetical protein
MADERILASAIAGVEHLAVFDDMVRERLADIDLQALLVNMVDVVPEDALIWLARQFGIMGNEGWAFTTTVEQRRELVKAAVELHRRKGTPWAIKNAIERGTVITSDRIGFVEGSALDEVLYYDGSVFYDGHFYGSEAHWAEFSVVIDVDGFPDPIVAGLSPLLHALVQEYKPARSHLVDVSFARTFEDSAEHADVVGFDVEKDLDDEMDLGIFYDDSYTYDGSLAYDDDALDLTTEAVLAPCPPIQSGLVAYYDARDGLVLQGSTHVEQMTDLYGLGFHASQANGSKRPLYVADDGAGLPTVRFGGSSEVLGTTFTTASPFSVVAIIRPNGTGTVFGSRTSFGVIPGVHVSMVDTDVDGDAGHVNATVRYGSTTGTITGTQDVFGKKMVALQVPSPTANARLSTNGVQDAVLAINAATASNLFHIGATSQAAGFGRVDVYALAIYNRALSNAEVTDLYTFFQSQFPI